MSIPYYCRPCGENLLPEQRECPFCGQMAVPVDELPYLQTYNLVAQQRVADNRRANRGEITWGEYSRRWGVA